MLILLSGGIASGPRTGISIRVREAVKKSGLSQAPAKRSLLRKDLDDARLTAPAFFHSFPPRPQYTRASPPIPRLFARNPAHYLRRWAPGSRETIGTATSSGETLPDSQRLRPRAADRPSIFSQLPVPDPPRQPGVILLYTVFMGGDRGQLPNSREIGGSEGRSGTAPELANSEIIREFSANPWHAWLVLWRRVCRTTSHSGATTAKTSSCSTTIVASISIPFASGHNATA